jgi:hypothetical protein
MLPSVSWALAGAAVFLAVGMGVSYVASQAQEGHNCAGCQSLRHSPQIVPVRGQERVAKWRGGPIVARPSYSASKLRVPQLAALPPARFARSAACFELLKRHGSPMTPRINGRLDCIRFNAPTEHASLPDILLVPPDPQTAALSAKLGLPVIEAVPSISILQIHGPEFQLGTRAGPSLSKGKMP